MPRFLLAGYASVVDLGADHQNEVGHLYLILTPARPSFLREALVLIYRGIDPAGAQPVGERQHSRLVRVVVVAVADEHLRCGRHVPLPFCFSGSMPHPSGRAKRGRFVTPNRKAALRTGR